ncbi:Alpha-mannosidase [Plasmodiophora brassicae]
MTIAWLCSVALLCWLAGADESLPMLNVHLVPHTHDDVGWLKTVDQYYVGSKQETQRASVRYVLDTTIRALLEDSKRKFIYVEVAFFERWWTEQTDAMKDKVRELVHNGQLEFINGGWAMNDEACVFYQSTIDQMTLGHRWLNDTFNVQPTIGWAVDPFGHSSQQASAFADIGFTTFVLGRVDDQDRSWRKTAKELEFIWRPSKSLGPGNQILGAITPEGYYPPGDFCIDETCNDDPLQDRDDLFDNNMEAKADKFAKEVREWASWYRDGDMMLTMGGDFHYSNAHINFANLDKLIAYFNKRTDKYRMNLFYSTPTAYFAKRLSDTAPYAVKTDDFFPYGTGGGHAYWVGYYTSRPAFKRYGRVSNAHLQVCKQLQALAGTGGDVETLKRAMAVSQHHDAVSGTEKQHVANDYAKRLAIGSAGCDDVIQRALEKLTGSASVKYERCPLLNISVCEVTQGSDRFSVTAYNSLGQERSEFLQIPVESPSWIVTDASGNDIDAQIVSNIHDQATSGDVSASIYTLFFRATTPPLGFAVYTVRKASPDEATSAPVPWIVTRKEDGCDAFVLENDKLRVQLCPKTGRVKKITNKADEIIVEIDQTWHQYISHDDQGGGPSGAYIFRPQTQEPEPIGPSPKRVMFSRGPLVSQVHQTFSDGVSQTIRLWHDAEHVEIEFTVGPIDVDDGLGREVVTRYSSDIASGDKFATDSNGREMMDRRRDYRPTWLVDIKEPVASNYYPVTTAISLRDDGRAMTVLTDRSQGGTSLRSGQLELMVHRRTLFDDHLGVGEPINELGADKRGLVIRGTHRLIVSKPERAAHLHRILQDQVAHPFAPKFAALPSLSSDTVGGTTMYTGLTTSLPEGVQLVTVEELPDGDWLVRLGHQFAVDEDSGLSTSVSIDLASTFKGRCIQHAVELNLSANQVRKEASANGSTAPWKVSLAPMEIKTWKIRFGRCSGLDPVATM